MRRITFILLFTYLAYLFQPIYILIDFKINQDFIVKELCENKEEPELKCNGKCYLMKKLEKAVGKVKKVDKNESNPQNNSEDNTIPDFLSKHIVNCENYDLSKLSSKQGETKHWFSHEFNLDYPTPPPQILI